MIAMYHSLEQVTRENIFLSYVINILLPYGATLEKRLLTVSQLCYKIL